MTVAADHNPIPRSPSGLKSTKHTPSFLPGNDWAVSNECPLCQLHTRLNELESSFSSQLAQFYDGASDVRVVMNAASEAVQVHKIAKEAEIAGLKKLNESLKGMLDWWLANCQIEEALSEEDPDEEATT